MPAKGSDVVERRFSVEHHSALRCGDKCTHRQPTAKCCWETQDIGDDVVILEGKQGPGSKKTCLDLIKNKKGPCVGTFFAYFFQRLSLCRYYAALSLNRLHNNGSAITAYYLQNTVRIVDGQKEIR